MFNKAESFGELDTSSMSDIKVLFSDAPLNADLSRWDVSQVTDMNTMFAAATEFNGNISRWDVSTVTNMSTMFWTSASFNADISRWDVSEVIDMSTMFGAAS